MAYPDPDPLAGFRHYDLPMPSLEDLARHVDREPGQDVINAVHAAMEASAEPDSPYWVHAEVHQTRRDITIAQVAWVFVNHPNR